MNQTTNSPLAQLAATAQQYGGQVTNIEFNQGFGYKHAIVQRGDGSFHGTHDGWDSSFQLPTREYTTTTGATTQALAINILSITKLPDMNAWQKSYMEVQGGTKKSVCFSDNGQTPAPNAPQPQSSVCATCPKNQPNSGSNGTGRACSAQLRIYVQLPDLYKYDDTGATVQDDTIFQLILKWNSTGEYKGEAPHPDGVDSPFMPYVKALAEFGIPLHGATTLFYAVPNVPGYYKRFTATELTETSVHGPDGAKVLEEADKLATVDAPMFDASAPAPQGAPASMPQAQPQGAPASTPQAQPQGAPASMPQAQPQGAPQAPQAPAQPQAAPGVAAGVAGATQLPPGMQGA